LVAYIKLALFFIFIITVLRKRDIVAAAAVVDAVGYLTTIDIIVSYVEIAVIIIFAVVDVVGVGYVSVVFSIVIITRFADYITLKLKDVIVNKLFKGSYHYTKDLSAFVLEFASS